MEQRCRSPRQSGGGREQAHVARVPSQGSQHEEIDLSPHAGRQICDRELPPEPKELFDRRRLIALDAASDPPGSQKERRG